MTQGTSRPTLTLRFSDAGLDTDPVLGRHLEPPPELRPPPLDARVQAAALRAWQQRTRSEYVGMLIMRHLHGLLVDLNAPMDLQQLAIAAMLQEHRHAALCACAASALGGDGTLRFDLDELQLTRSADPLELQLLDLAVGTLATGEVVALALLTHAIRVLPDSGFREILQRIARDEVGHARLGVALATSLRDDAWAVWPGDEAARRQIDAWRTLMAGRDVIEMDEAALFDLPEAEAQLRAIGIPPSLPFRDAYHQALAHEVPRGLARLGLGDAEGARSVVRESP